jgi:hypothetical protein
VPGPAAVRERSPENCCRSGRTLPAHGGQEDGRRRYTVGKKTGESVNVAELVQKTIAYFFSSEKDFVDGHMEGCQMV